MKPYLTKLAFGRWWFYLDTKRKYRTRIYKMMGWPLIVVSYKKRAAP